MTPRFLVCKTTPDGIIHVLAEFVLRYDAEVHAMTYEAFIIEVLT